MIFSTDRFLVGKSGRESKIAGEVVSAFVLVLLVGVVNLSLALVIHIRGRSIISSILRL